MHTKIAIKYFLIFFFALPIPIIRSETRIVDFHARRENKYAVLEWATEAETNLQKFLIQRSNDNINWATIGEIMPQSGNSSSRREYRYVDKDIFKNSIGNFYYRLIIVSKDGQQTPHEVIVSITGSSGIKHTWGSLKAMFR